MSTLATRLLYAASGLMLTTAVAAGPIYQPPGANLTYGDVTHGQRVQSASTNPAAGAADVARRGQKETRGTIFSASAGLEYGNIENLFEFYDRLTAGYNPSEPGEGGGPGQDPGDKPVGGIDLGEIWDQLDPDIQAAVQAIGAELARQTALLAIIRTEGYGKAWVAADLPFVLGTEYLGGAWTFGVNWSGSTKAFGLADEIEFDPDAARAALEDWFNQLPADRPVQLPVSSDVMLHYDIGSNGVRLGIINDSSIIAKSTRTMEFNAGYSRKAWSNDSGSLFLGMRGQLYLMDLTRVSVRFGDITDTEDLFDEIRSGVFRSDTRLGMDVGALWVADHYQLGMQIKNLNEPRFQFPALDLELYGSERIIEFLQTDQTYTMNRQVKLEASIFGKERRWSAHVGLDAGPATDPLGDEYQWLTLSTGFTTDSRWIPGFRFGYRENLAGTGLKYVSAGLTAFRFLNFDVSSALDTVRIEGRDLPQGLMLSLGFQVNW
ncbi:MAG: conjugal transfer protein TraF [Gammaproteobacteria bacterium]|nr:conjugal transfer protein TraF [Gammaproteobacteria bacterium]